MKNPRSVMVKLPKVAREAARLDQVCLPAKHSAAWPLGASHFRDISSRNRVRDIGLAVLSLWIFKD